MKSWILINEEHAKHNWTHFLFVCEKTNEIAIADHSIRDLGDPGSTDDGFLIWSGAPIKVRNLRDLESSKSGIAVDIPVIQYARDDHDLLHPLGGSIVPTGILTAVFLSRVLDMPLWQLVPQIGEIMSQHPLDDLLPVDYLAQKRAEFKHYQV